MYGNVRDAERCARMRNGLRFIRGSVRSRGIDGGNGEQKKRRREIVRSKSCWSYECFDVGGGKSSLKLANGGEDAGAYVDICGQL